MQNFLLAVIGFIFIVFVLAAILALPKVLKGKEDKKYIYVYYRVEDGVRKKHILELDSFWQAYWRYWVNTLASFIPMLPF